MFISEQLDRYPGEEAGRTMKGWQEKRADMKADVQVQYRILETMSN